MAEFKNYYKLLDIPYDDNPELKVVEAGFKKKLKEIRPDINLDDETRRLFEDLQEARKILTDPLRTSLYNLQYHNHYFGKMFNFLGDELNKTVQEAEQYMRDIRKP